MNTITKRSSRSKSKPKSKARSSSRKALKNKKHTQSHKPGMDPKPPKIPMSPFLRYRNHVLPEYKKQMSDRSMAAITETIAHSWSKMSKDEKLRFNEEFLDDVQDYVSKRDRFEQENGPVRHLKFTLDEDEPLKGMYYNSVAGEGQLIKLSPENHMKHKGPRKRVTNNREKEHSPEDDAARAKSERPAPPKKPQTVFFLFKKEQFEKAKAKNPEANAPEISSILADEWRNLSRNKKKKYEDQYEKDFENYQKELKAWEKSYGKLPKRKRSQQPSSAGKKIRMSQYEMKVKERLGVRPQIYPSEDMIGNKPRNESRRRARSWKGVTLLDYFSDDPDYSTSKKAGKSANSSNKKKVLVPKTKASKS